MALNLQNEEWYIVDGVLKRYSGTSNDVTILDGVTEIGSKVFYGKGINSVIIPESVIALALMRLQIII